MTQTTLTRERADLLQSLRRHRHFLRYTVRDLTDEQAATRSTVSELTLGGLIKHVASTEAAWMRFANLGAEGLAQDPGEWEKNHRMLPGDTLAGLLAEYDRVAAETDAQVATLDLDAEQALPQAPWFEPGARWSTRRVLLHIIAETAQHAGHADILREAIDGAKTMG